MRLLEMFPALTEADITDEEIMQRMQSITQNARALITLIQTVLQDPKIPWEHRNKLADAVTHAEDISRDSNLGRPRGN